MQIPTKWALYVPTLGEHIRRSYLREVDLYEILYTMLRLLKVSCGQRLLQQILPVVWQRHY